MRLRPWGTHDEGGLSKPKSALIQAMVRITDGGPAGPGGTVGRHTGGVPWVNALRDSSSPESGPGGGNHLLRRAPPATCPARCSSHSPSPTNEIKGGAQSGSLPEALWWPFLRRAIAHK